MVLYTTFIKIFKVNMKEIFTSVSPPLNYVILQYNKTFLQKKLT